MLKIFLAVGTLLAIVWMFLTFHIGLIYIGIPYRVNSKKLLIVALTGFIWGLILVLPCAYIFTNLFSINTFTSMNSEPTKVSQDHMILELTKTTTSKV